MTTTPIYTQYKTFCEHAEVNALSNRRFRDRLNDLADTNVLNKRHGVVATRISTRSRSISIRRSRTSRRNRSVWGVSQRFFENRVMSELRYYISPTASTAHTSDTQINWALPRKRLFTVLTPDSVCYTSTDCVRSTHDSSPPTSSQF